HTREDEAYFVLVGELEVTVGHEVFILRPGDTLMAPRDLPHQLRNSGDVENHYLLVFSPSGFEEFLRATAVPAPDNAPAPTKPPMSPVKRAKKRATEFETLSGGGTYCVTATERPPATVRDARNRGRCTLVCL